mmetsp:Transcript_94565/g.294129  ORF Transcript_94565/g.294129 Transcript_94565/m.294129 type:complete len:295 (-) Transcript_94565:1658-2542(-)
MPRQACIGDLYRAVELPQPQVGHAEIHVGCPEVRVQKQAPVQQVHRLLRLALVQGGHAQEVERVRVRGEGLQGRLEQGQRGVPPLGGVGLDLLGQQDTPRALDEGLHAGLHRRAGPPCHGALGHGEHLAGLRRLAHGHAEARGHEGGELRPVLRLVGLGRGLRAPEEVLHRVAQRGVDLEEVRVADGRGAGGARGADDPLPEAVGLHVALGQLPVAAQPLHLQVLRGERRGAAGLALAPAQGEAHAHGAVEGPALPPRWDGGAAPLHDEARALVRPPVPALLVEGAAVETQVGC